MSAVLGIDPSLASTGWALVDTSPLILRASGTIKTNARATRHERLAEIFNRLQGVVCRYTVSHVAYEGAVGFGHSGARMGGTLAVAEARGAILAAVAYLHTVEEVAQATAKKAVTGSGASKKKAVTAAIRLLFNDPKLTADECDAAAVALAAGGYAVPPTTKAKQPRAKVRANGGTKR